MWFSLAIQVDALLVGGVSLGAALLALLVAIFLVVIIMIQPAGDEKMKEISKAIRNGAMAFLGFEYLLLLAFAIILFIIIAVLINWETGINYLVGTICSAVAGAIGMFISCSSNARTAEAAKKGMSAALRTSFNSGSVMGLSVVGTGLLGMSVMLMIFGEKAFNDIGVIAGFGMGATTLSFFSRVGGGIFTKAADVGADLVGKVEVGIPEDDPRNPATIADNVGDNVGDIAGMGADLQGSFNGSIIASGLLGFQQYGMRGVAYPFWICAAGVLTAMVGMLLVRCRNKASGTEVLLAFRVGLIVTNVLQIGAMVGITFLLDMPWTLFGSIIIGLVAGYVIALNSEFFTSSSYNPTKGIASSASTGAAGVIITGLSVGMTSIILPALVIAASLLAAISLSGIYGVALASTGLLSTIAFSLATDAYGPVADNAGGIAEMAGLDPQVRERTDILDAIGNTTAAVGKGFAIASAVLAGFSLLSVYKTKVNLGPLDAISDPYAVAGIIVGSMVPFVFAAFTMSAVATGAEAVVVEVRRQFREKPGIMDGTEKPNYATCVISVTASSIHAMIFPGILTIIVPIVAGIAFPLQFLGALLLGQICTGFLLAAMMAASGGAWDNAKKYIETGQFGGKTSDAHKAAVVGDTVGDPFKDTSGPAINILIKLSDYMSVVLAPMFVSAHQKSLWWVAIIIGVLTLLLGVVIHYLTPIRIYGWYQKCRGIDTHAPNNSKPEIHEIDETRVSELQTAKHNPEVAIQ